MEGLHAAINYYANILERQSPGFKYPIIQLIGHRGQAPGHVKNVARNPAELTALLAKYPNVFKINNGTVMLSKHCDILNDAAVEYYSNIIKKNSNSGMPINNLFGHRSQAPPGVYSVVKNPAELLSFILKHPDTFRLEDNNVFLTKSSRLQKEIVSTASCLHSLTINEHVSNSYTLAVNYYSNILKKISPNGKFPIAQLIGHRSQASHDVQSVAKTAEDLFKFLRGYPNIFIVTNDKFVTLKSTIMTNSLTGQCNAKKENLKKICNFTAAARFYANILEKKDSALEFSIRQLVGYRGHAPHDVQNCAKNEEELLKFLSSHPDTFTVTQNKGVFLTKSLLQNNSTNKRPQQTSISCERVSDYESAVVFYSDILKTVSPNSEYPIKQLISYRTQGPTSIKNIAKNEMEFISFLKKYPHIFTVRDDIYVGITKRNEMERISYHVFNKMKAAEHIMQSPAASHYSREILNLSELSELPQVFDFYEGMTILPAAIHSAKVAATFYLKVLLNTTEKMLSLQSLLDKHSQAPSQAKIIVMNELRLTRLLSSYPTIFIVRDGFVYLTEYWKENKTDREINCCKPTHVSESCISMNNSYFPPINSHNKNREYINDWESYVLNNTTIIEDHNKCKSVCQVVLKENVIALDCEGYNLGRRGYISIIQIGLVNGQIYIFDIWEDQNMIHLGGLKTVLESEKIVKVTNFCSNDSINLMSQFNVALKNVLDVSVAYHVIENGILTMSNFKPAGLNQICSKYGAPMNSSKDDIKYIYKTKPAYWLGRPLTEEMVAYAALDVASLVPYLYEEFLKRLDDRTASAVWILSQKLCKTP